MYRTAERVGERLAERAAERIGTCMCVWGGGNHNFTSALVFFHTSCEQKRTLRTSFLLTLSFIGERAAERVGERVAERAAERIGTLFPPPSMSLSITSPIDMCTCTYINYLNVHMLYR